MLDWSLSFLIIAIIAALMGFGGIASGSAEIARVCFSFFVAAFIASLLWHLLTGRRSAPPL